MLVFSIRPESSLASSPPARPQKQPLAPLTMDLLQNTYSLAATGQPSLLSDQTSLQ